jgi:hypothetical protein
VIQVLLARTLNRSGVEDQRMTADDLLREIEIAAREQREAVADLKADPEDPSARRRVRMATGMLRVLRAQLGQRSAEQR